MIKLLRNKYLFLFSLVLLLWQGPASGSDRLSGIIEGVHEKYRDLPGLKVGYTREVITRSMSMLGAQARGDLATGHIFFKPPHFLRLEQETPKPETIITNGETLWWYIPDKRRAHKYPSEQFGKELNLLSDIFRGFTQLEKRFKVGMVDQNDEGEYLIQLKPDPPWQDIDRIRITVTPKYDIRVLDIYNQLGSVTRFTLKNLAVKKAFEKDFFRFSLPEGVRLIEEGELRE
ncbi:MAG: outer membrane lipoprotein carrier protein LolA, partial [Desulfobacteraceae bacterium]|jgi:outer membrane lipoprotein-sorting protein|nr:outer membrane lipoprotein carrier protein LolA [Desulfobacteraceae bacterium]